MKTYLRYIIICFFSVAELYAQDCGQNLGFEEGDFSNWEASRYDGNPGQNCGPMYQNEVLLPPTCPYPPCVTCEDAPCKDPNNMDVCPVQTETGFNFTGAPQVNAPLDCPARLQPSVTPRFSLTSGGGPDPNEPSINPTSQHPLSGNYSARLGNTGTGYQAECMWNRFLVTEQNKMFIFSYAVFLEDPIDSNNQHHLYDSPRFMASLTNDQGEDVGCGTRFSALSLDARDPGNGFQIAQNPFCAITPQNDPSPDNRNVSNVYYRDWRSVSVNLNNELGNYVTIKFCTADCGRGGHYGYAYVDIFCPPPQKGYYLCTHNEPVTLSGPPGFGDYRWYAGPDTNGAFLDTGFNYVVQQPRDGDMFTVKYKPEFGAECNTLMVTDTIRIFQAYAWGDTAYCANEAPATLQLKSATNAPNATHTWRSIPPGFVSSETKPLLTSSEVPLQNTTYIVDMVWDQYSCRETDTIVVEVHDLEISATATGYACGQACAGTATVIISPGSRPPHNILWNDPDRQTTSTATGLCEGEYTVRVIDANGCVATTTVTVPVTDTICDFEVWFPNAFTPDEAGRGPSPNNKARVRGRGIAELEIRIFDRWGELVYHSTDIDEAMNTGWDGKFRGDRVDVDSYAWYLTARSECCRDAEDPELFMKGSLTLLR